MEAKDNIFFESIIYLNKNKKLDSAKTDKSFLLSCVIEDDMFKIKANDDYDEFLNQFQMKHWIKRTEREFTKRINNFKLLAQTIKEAYEKKRLVLNKIDDYSLMLTIYYTIIFKEEHISFELYRKDEDEEEQKRKIGKFFSESEDIRGLTDKDYKAELLEYSKKFEDYGDTSYIKIRIKNMGTTTWNRKITSFKCVPEYSTLICNDFILNEDVYADNECEIELEFIKKNPNNIDAKYFTSIQLNVYDQPFEPMLILDFDDAFKDEEKKTDENKINDYEDDNENKINIIKEDKKEENENKIIIHEDKKDFKKDDINLNLINDNKKDEIKINLDEKNKSKIVFDNVKVNISFNVESMYKVICIDVNENKVKFNIDKNQFKIINSKGNKIHVEEKKPVKQTKKLLPKKESNQINESNQGKNNKDRASITDRAKMFDIKS